MDEATEGLSCKYMGFIVTVQKLSSLSNNSNQPAIKD